ncbi:hypothetical protein DFH06DRAFT_1483627, partial [Mycena polygramma]
MSELSLHQPDLQLARDAQLTQYLALASSTLVIFEWLISLRREVDMVWVRRKSLVTESSDGFMSEPVFCLRHNILRHIRLPEQNAVRY